MWFWIRKQYSQNYSSDIKLDFSLGLFRVEACLERLEDLSIGIKKWNEVSRNVAQMVGCLLSMQMQEVLGSPVTNT